MKYLIMATIGLLSTFPTLADKDYEITDEEKKLFNENYLVPSPNELFKALDSLDIQNWQEIIQTIRANEYVGKDDYNSSLSLSMNLGVRVADGFLAVAAKDKALILELAPVIKRLASQLGASRTLLGAGDDIKSHAEAGRWSELGQLLETLQMGVLEEMKHSRDHDAVLVGTISGWLEGVHLVTHSLSKSYNEDAAAMLRQPWLINHFSNSLASLDDKTKQNPMVKALAEGLKKLEPLCDVAKEESVPEENIQKIYEITSSLIMKIQRSKA